MLRGRIIPILFILTVVFVFRSLDITAQEQEKMIIAVVEFDVKGDLGIQDAGAIIAEWMISSIGKTDQYDLKERVLLKKILEEQQLGLTGVLDEQTVSKIGSLYGVKGIVTGTVIKWGDIVSVTVRLIDTDTGSILKTADVKTNDANDIPNQIDELALIISGKAPDEDKPDIIRPGPDHSITVILTVSGRIQTDDPWVSGGNRTNAWAKPMYRIWFDTNGNSSDGAWGNGMGSKQAEIWLDTGRLGFWWYGGDGRPGTADDVKIWPVQKLDGDTWRQDGIAGFISDDRKSLQVNFPLKSLENAKTLEVSFMASPWTTSASDNLGSGANSRRAWIVISNTAQKNIFTNEDGVGDNAWPSLDPNRKSNFDLVKAQVIVE